MSETVPQEVLAVYLTFPDPQAAERIAAELVERRLVACVNLFAPVLSIYRWEGAVQREREVVGVAKTTRTKLAELTRVVAELHPYEVPCVVAYPAAGGFGPYLGWVEQETRGRA